MFLLAILAKHTPSPAADLAVAAVRNHCQNEDHLVEMLHALKLLAAVGYTRQELVELARQKAWSTTHPKGTQQ